MTIGELRKLLQGRDDSQIVVLGLCCGGETLYLVADDAIKPGVFDWHGEFCRGVALTGSGNCLEFYPSNGRKPPRAAFKVVIAELAPPDEAS